MHRTRLFSPLLLLLTLLFLAALACNVAGGNDTTTTTTVSESEIIDAAVATIQAQGQVIANPPLTGDDVTRTVVSVESGLQEVLIDLYGRVNPSVVFILANTGDAFLGSGSGFIYDTAGHIVTNHHVLAEGDNFEVFFADGSATRATPVGSDPDSDLAVLRVDTIPESARPVVLGDSAQVQVGELVVALGSPFGQQGSMSLGIVSGLGRSIPSQQDTGLGGTYSLPQVIQTDAPINPGNSGGPLLSLDGEVIGVNSAIRTLTGFNSGVGFAIPVNAVHRIVPALISEGSYTYPFMGIQSIGRQLTLAEQEAFGLPQPDGVYVSAVTPGSPADAAGLIAAGTDNLGGDFIIAVDGRDVNEFNDLISYLVFETEVGQTITLTVIRNGETIEVPLTLGERP